MFFFSVALVPTLRYPVGSRFRKVGDSPYNSCMADRARTRTESQIRRYRVKQKIQKAVGTHMVPMCLGVWTIIPDIQRSFHNPDITLSEIGFVLFGAKNTFAGKKGRKRGGGGGGGGGQTRTGQTDFVRSSD